MEDARTHQDCLLKPRGALGLLEALSVRVAGMTGGRAWRPTPPAACLFAADHGVMAHQVSTVPQAITAYMVAQFCDGRAAVNVLARQMGARLRVVDVGVVGDLPDLPTVDGVTFSRAKIAHGTRDFTQADAMTPAQAAAAVQVGATAARAALDDGAACLVIGEMGIGNTTSASALIAALTGAPAAAVTGRGTGLDDDGYARKVRTVEAGLGRHAGSPDPLAALGGLEIAAMAGAMLAAAERRVPVVIDGLICTAAALAAQHIAPPVVDYLIAGHCGAEPGHRIALDRLGLVPLLHLDMRLGEGTGALLALPLIEAAMRTLDQMGTLDVG
jgi:nicotinate-nucleotide--dimethylbenzimidazole phosphoribosyltransferase